MGSIQDILRPKHARWTLPLQSTTYADLRFDQATLGPLGDDEVAVELRAASLNYRDLMIAKSLVSGEIKPNVVAGSDGAGIVMATGKNVSQFAVGDRVVTHLAPCLSDDQFPTMQDISAGLGHAIDGTLREFGHFHESALVHAPQNLSFERATTLTCSGLTAWNALFGLPGRQLQAGDWVLVQGTGGVSIAALQFALAKGANVVATTSSHEKAQRMRALGVNTVLNYRQMAEWGDEARKATPDGRGFDIVVDVGGESTLRQSLATVRANGIIALTGILGGAEERPVAMLSALWHICITRGIVLGTRQQFRDMVAFVEEHDVQPVVDDVTFDLRQAKEAYERLEAQKHFSKVVIEMRSD